MEQRLSIVTLGVQDIARAARFYETLGWTRCDSPDGVIAFDLIGQTLALFPMQELLKDIGVAAEPKGFSGLTLAHNVREKSEVAPLIARAEAAGATVLKPAQEVFWGGYHGYFADLDGHIWEIAHNPLAPLGTDGRFQWNGA